jgi:hypothetical protein
MPWYRFNPGFGLLLVRSYPEFRRSTPHRGYSMLLYNEINADIFKETQIFTKMGLQLLPVHPILNNRVVNVSSSLTQRANLVIRN